MNLRRMLINYTSLNPTSNLAYSTNDIPERPPRMWDTVVFCLSDVDGPHLRLAKMRAEEVTVAVIEEHRKNNCSPACWSLCFGGNNGWSTTTFC